MKPVCTDGTEKRWAVMVDGTEVNDYLMDFSTALELGRDYLDEGYELVVIHQYDTGEQLKVC